MNFHLLHIEAMNKCLMSLQGLEVHVPLVYEIFVAVVCNSVIVKKLLELCDCEMESGNQI